MRLKEKGLECKDRQDAHPVALMSVAMSGVSHCARAVVHVVSCGCQQSATCSCAGSCARRLVVSDLVQRRGEVCRPGNISCSDFRSR